MERVRALLRKNAHHSAEEIRQEIRNTLAKHRGPAEPDDDLTFVIVKVL
jgi:serine phosphatase RsbU (regulator of sigma subunit)